MRSNPFLVIAAACLPTLLGACAGAAEGYPSLAMRPAELEAARESGGVEAPLVNRWVPPAPAPATLASLDELARAARESHSAFQEEAPSAQRIAGAGRAAGTGSEAWARAEVALASLTGARSRTMVPLAGIDRLYVAAATEGGDTTRIADVQREVEAMVAEEDRVLAAMQGG